MTWFLGISKFVAILVVVTCIKWVDITGEISGWVTEEDISEPVEVTSCGILIKEDDEFLYLAMDKSDEDPVHYNSTGIFPKGVIRDRIDVEVWEKD